MATSEPWLDSLSDEWASNKYSSSPSSADLASRSSCPSRTSNSSQSRIPHLSRNFSRSPKEGRPLRPRSSLGSRRASDPSVLGEHTASQLNAVAHKASGSARSVVPRKASTVFSGSLNSIQRHTIQHGIEKKDDHTPEWKRRLTRGEDVGGNGCDLFGPSRLEGMFKQPQPSSDSSDNVSLSVAAENTRLWSMPERYQTMRALKPRVTEMRVLREEDEDSMENKSPNPDSQGSQNLTRTTPLKGVVRERVLSFEGSRTFNNHSQAYGGSLRRDSRMRTISGQEEIHNESISPITTSTQNTIREQALKPLTDITANDLLPRFDNIVQCPPPPSSDDGVFYGAKHGQHEDAGELTSLSLPDDLSMGTQDFAIRGGFVNSRRGGRPFDGSLQQNGSSSSAPPTVEQSTVHLSSSFFPSSPPPRLATNDEMHHEMQTPRQPQGSDATERPRSSGSPLKIFGNYDTFTNDRLLRRMSQFEHDNPSSSSEIGREPDPLHEEHNMRISHFGQGDLDACTFEEHGDRHILPSTSHGQDRQMIFECSDSPDSRATQGSVQDPAHQTRGRGVQGMVSVEEKVEEFERVSSSPTKDRTPKRRRTLLQTERVRLGESAATDSTRHMGEAARLAGKKRKDARYEASELTADPTALASRHMLKPKTTRRISSNAIEDAEEEKSLCVGVARVEGNLTEELADELATFGIGITEVANDSRKPSVTTQDFLNEATKIMQIIRQRGRPKSGLGSVAEHGDDQAVNLDSILDLEVEDEETTADDFSRPPSRNGSTHKREELQIPADPVVVNHLRKFQDGDDLGLLLSSGLGSLHLAPEPYSDDAATVPLPPEIFPIQGDNLSCPVNIRIRESEAHERKRKHSTSTVEEPASLPTHTSSGTSTLTTIPTSSSASSGNKGRIPPGKVPVPDQVGVMTYDHSSKSWVRGKTRQLPRPSSRKSNSEEDPFGDIADLSIDERKEVKRGALAPSTLGKHDRSLDQRGAQRVEVSSNLRSVTASAVSSVTIIDPLLPAAETSAASCASLNAARTSATQIAQPLWQEKFLNHDKEVEHEIRIHDGRASEAPPSPNRACKKARAVTVAFSSPLASAIAEHNEHFLTSSTHSIAQEPVQAEVTHSSYQKAPSTISEFPGPMRRIQRPIASRNSFPTRAVSRIDEQDEDSTCHNLSLVHISQPNALTPARGSRMTRHPTTENGVSMIYLTPLSEFTLHQNDQARHVEASYIEQRVQPNSLRQAHGSTALAVDNLIKAVTDAVPDELYWEQLRRLDLTDKGLTTVHGLEEYCSSVEELHLSSNSVNQLSGVPFSVRILNIENNQLSDLTSWGHLHNLQYLDLSGNGLESLDGLSNLIHLRELRANSNRIRDLSGIFDLDGLLHLDAQYNELESVDFSRAKLQRLRYLNLSNNQLTTVRNVQALPALRTLLMEKNNLHTFEATDGACVRLQDLRLSCNQIMTINLAHTPVIKVLYLDKNRVQNIVGFEAARYLDVLSIREQSDSPNILNTLFSSPNECRKLYLSFNPIPSMGIKNPSQSHLNLKYLELASCGLTFLPPDFSSKIPNCRKLNLNFNAIRDVKPLRGCKRLNKLELSGNRLERLRRTCIPLTALVALRKIDLRNNPLTIGFYPPSCGTQLVVHGKVQTGIQDPYSLLPLDQSADSRWMTHLDDGTRMKRETMELLLAKDCLNMVELNGLPFDRAALPARDDILRMLMGIGIIASYPIKKDMLGLGDDEGLPPDADIDGD